MYFSTVMAFVLPLDNNIGMFFNYFLRARNYAKYLSASLYSIHKTTLRGWHLYFPNFLIRQRGGGSFEMK